jgi:hypothetical protein
MRNKSITALLMAISFSSSASAAMPYPQELLGWWSPSTCSASNEAYKATGMWMGISIDEKEGYWNEITNCNPTKVEKDKNNLFKIAEKCDSQGEEWNQIITYALSNNNLVVTNKIDKRILNSKYVKCESPLKKNKKK